VTTTDVLALRTFADRLIYSRAIVARMTAAEFARRCGFTLSTYATWEAGRIPSKQVAVCERIVAAFPELDVVWLLRGGVQISSYAKPA
jgi:transcriptional regulator with XRE-family HTH domain